jgi:hypothetical protein
MILFQLYSDGNGYISDKYYYKNLFDFEILNMVEEIKDYFQKI